MKRSKEDKRPRWIYQGAKGKGTKRKRRKKRKKEEEERFRNIKNNLRRVQGCM